MHHELAGGTFKHALQYISGKLAFGLLGGDTCFIDVRPLGFVSANRAFGRHNLQKLEHAGVAHGPGCLQSVMHLANGGGSLGPENPKDFEFGGSGFPRQLLHGERQYYEGVRSVNEKFRSWWAPDLKPTQVKFNLLVLGLHRRRLWSG